MKQFNGYTKGVDFGGWLSQCSEYTYEHYDTFVTKEDFKTVKSWGVDHIRLPIDYQLIQNNDGTLIERGFSYIQNAIDWAGENGLNLILDLHKTLGYSFDVDLAKNNFFESEQLHEYFYTIWDEFAKRYSKYADRVAFELLNEVTSPSYSDVWNKISHHTVEIIRKYSSDVKILIGGYWNNSIDALKDLEMPYDENIVYNFHCYDPLVFTHQGAYWVNGMPADLRMDYPVNFEEYNKVCDANPAFKDFRAYPPAGKTTIDKDYFINKFMVGVKLCEERNVPLYCGEYGVIENAKPEFALAWYKDIHAAFEELKIGRACWSLREMNFGLVDEHMKPVFDEIIKYL